MTKISILEQLKQADAEGYAIPHFNYSDIWDMTAMSVPQKRCTRP